MYFHQRWKKKKEDIHSSSHFIYVVVFVEFPFSQFFPFFFSFRIDKMCEKAVRSILSPFFHFYLWQTQKGKEEETKVVRACYFRPLFHFAKQPFYYFTSKFSGLFHGFQTLIELDGYIYSFILFSFIVGIFFYRISEVFRGWNW